MSIDNSRIVGWREWASLPTLGIPFIKAKIDTGAKTSALHAYDLEIITIDGKEYAKFFIHPLQRNDSVSIEAVAKIVDKRIIRSSNGQKEERLVIRSPIKIGNHSLDIDITLTNRDIMHHRMLIGREAMTSILVNPTKTYCQGKVSLKQIRTAYIPL